MGNITTKETLQASNIFTKRTKGGEREREKEIEPPNK